MVEQSVSAAAPASAAPDVSSGRAPPASAAPVSEETPARAGAAGGRRAVLALVALVVVVGAVLYWLHARQFEETDDAQVDGNISSVSPRISGNVSGVLAVENQPVKEGDVLATIDPVDLRIAVEQARAQVAQAQAQLEAEDPSVPIIQTTNQTAIASAGSDMAAAQAGLSAARKEVDQLTAQLAQAEANDRQAQLEKVRSERLVAQGAVSEAEYDQRVNAAAASAANVLALRGSLDAARDRVSQQQAQMIAIASRFREVQSNAPRQVATRQATVFVRQAALDLAKAQLEQAERNLGYATIQAPIGGIIAKKSLSVGDHVAPGQQVIAIAQTDALWVTANFRETQLERMHPGQPVTVHVDALDLDLHGSVESVGGATGSRLSVLPPENASGNYVKVVQRIPVRIRLDPGQAGLDRLRIGMSTEPKVTVR
ncbi:MAG: HlyD family secretion protein [Myxococcales bacterium]|nr:HlyD family secretion protein [Myxococcales bacterium]